MWTPSHIIQLWYKYIHWTEGRTKRTGTGGRHRVLRRRDWGGRMDGTHGHRSTWTGRTHGHHWTCMDRSSGGQWWYDQERMAPPVGREEGILLVGTGGGPVWGIMTRTVTERPGERDQRGSRQPDKFGRSGHLKGTSDSQVRTALRGHWMVPLRRREGDGPLSPTQLILIIPRTHAKKERKPTSH